jgi:hypothetical protein
MIHSDRALFRIQRFFSRLPRRDVTIGHHLFSIAQITRGQRSRLSDTPSLSLSVSSMRIVRVDLAIFPEASFIVRDTVYTPG